MHGMVDTLLQLARADSQQYVLKLEAIHIGELLRECWSPFVGRSAERGLKVEWSIHDSACALVDREAVRLVFANLLDNAVSYAVTDGELQIAVFENESQIIVTIANDGCTLDSSQVSYVFDRYWRGDVARTDSGRHCGLGLALCKPLVELHRGTIIAEVDDGWFRATLTFPSIVPSPSRPRPTGALV